MQVKNYIDYLKYNIELSKKQYWFFIETTSFCNAKCEFCINPELKRKCHMSDETFEKVLSRIEDEKIKPIGFCMHLNGEPLMDKKIIDRINMIGERFPGITIEMTTNFALANDNIIKELIDSKLGILRISLNVADEIEYNRRMNLYNFQGTLDNVNKIVSLNNQRGSIRIIVTAVENDGNIEQIEKLRNIVLQEKGCEFRAIREGSWERKTTQTYHYGKRIICDAVYKTVCILSNGEYSMCCYDAEGLVGLNVENVSIIDAMNSEFYKNIRKEHLRRSLCDTICNGCSRYL